MGERHISSTELGDLVGNTAETGEVYADLERRSEAVHQYLDVEAASMRDKQPNAYVFLNSFAEANLARERGAALDLPPDSAADVRTATIERQADLDVLIRKFRELGSGYDKLREQAEDLREHLNASLATLSDATPEQLRVLYREATTMVPVTIRDLSRDAYDHSLGTLASDEMFSHFPGEIETLSRGEPMDDQEAA